ncbi:MAG: TVP38/TMEM64 family protein [Butyrivibrio sp.]|nr:TVP38/TMEM64 family protein [Butyrivibrio sp.]
MTDKKKKIIVSAVVVSVVILMAAVTYYVGKPMIKFVSEPERFRAWVDNHGIWGRLAFLGMTMLQVIVAVIPGEPMELVAGYAFGSVEGTALCIIGATLGGIPVFLLVRKFGMRAVEVFFSKEKTDSLKFLKSSPKRDMWIFILFLIPGTPKDLLNYFVGLTDMKMSKWLLISLVARFPSIVTSTVGGDALGMKKYAFAAVVFAATLAVSAAGIAAYNKICRRHKENESKVDN